MFDGIITPIVTPFHRDAEQSINYEATQQLIDLSLIHIQMCIRDRFKGVAELNAAVQAGLKLEKVQIGGLGGGPGRKAVNNAITLDRADADTLLELEKMGIEIYFQTTPDYPSETLQKAVAKL